MRSPRESQGNQTRHHAGFLNQVQHEFSHAGAKNQRQDRSKRASGNLGSAFQLFSAGLAVRHTGSLLSLRHDRGCPFAAKSPSGSGQTIRGGWRMTFNDWPTEWKKARGFDGAAKFRMRPANFVPANRAPVGQPDGQVHPIGKCIRTKGRAGVSGHARMACLYALRG